MIIPHEGSRFRRAPPERCEGAPRNLGDFQLYVFNFFPCSRRDDARRDADAEAELERFMRARDGASAREESRA